MLKSCVLLVAAMLLASCSKGSGEPKGAASPLRVRLMTSQQYIQSISYLFGSDIGDALIAPLPPLNRTHGLLESGAASIGVTADQLQHLQDVAFTVANKVVDESHREFLIPCKPKAADAPDAACAKQFLGKVGRLWYRRALSDAELKKLVDLSARAAEREHDFYAGLATVLEGMLMSSEGLFIVDRAEPDPSKRGARRLDAYSLAARLSFFLWNAAPDEALMQAAEDGTLATDRGRARVVDAMLSSSRLTDGLNAFFDDMLEFNDFDALSKDASKYPQITGATLADAREQTLRTLVDHIVVQKADYRDLFTTRKTFMSMSLAAVYGVPTVEGWTPYEFSDGSHRSGILTQVSFLAAHAHPARSSATRRGKAMREIFLCETVPDPPPNVDFSKLNDPDPSLHTARDRLKVHSINPSCAGCHKLMDPIGLALENFDGAGAYRLTEMDAPLLTDGALDGKPFDNLQGLERLLHDHPAVPKCLVNRLYSYATGGPASPVSDGASLKHFTQDFAASGYRVMDLLRDIALSDAFSKVREPKGAAPTLLKAGVTDTPAPIAMNGGSP